MKYLRSLRQRHYLAAALLLACISLVGVGVMRSAASRRMITTPADFHSSPSPDQIKQGFREQIKRGLGSQVRFADAKASSRQIQESVEAAARFISGRSGFGMSEETKKRLIKVEQRTLTGGAPRLTAESLAAVLTTATVEQVLLLTDEKIAQMALTEGRQGISLSANGDMSLTPEQFTIQVKILRGQLASDNIAAREAVQAAFEKEVQTRISALSDAAPEQFGRSAEGLTPLQAVVIAYSVVVDDSLGGSQEDLGKTIEVRPAAAAKAKKIRETGRTVNAFGPKGLIFTSPTSFIFNRRMVNDLMNQFEKGGTGR